jgi:hypothetical protein
MFRLVFALLRSKVIKELFCEGLVGFRMGLPKAEAWQRDASETPKAYQ